MDILMPQLGETVAEGKITTWFKGIGDPVAPGDNLFEIETDKVSMEVPATAPGVIAEIRVAAGEVAPVPSAITATTVPTGATSPSGTRISVSTPAVIDGTSIDTLSVSISNRLSPGFTASPADLNHLVILPSATVSPSCGISTSMDARVEPGHDDEGIFI